MTKYTYSLYTSDGERLAELEDLERVEYWRALNTIGGFHIITRPDFPTDWLGVDKLIEFWRQPEGGESTLQIVGMMRWWEWMENEAGNEVLHFGGTDQNDLLDRRIVAYAAGNALSDITDEANQMLATIVDSNMGATAFIDEAGRPRALDAAHFTVATVASGTAPSVSRRFAWRDVFPILQEIADASRDLGTPLYFDIVSTGPARFEFRTYMNVRGVDRTITSGLNPVIFSKELKNLDSPSMREDWSNEHNYVWGGGQGEEEDRVIDPEDDVFRMHRSIWNRREVFQDAREEDTTLGVANKAFRRMQHDRPRLRFTGRLLDTPNSRYGIDWSFGDKVTARYHGEYDGIVDAVRHMIDNEGVEDLTARLEVDIATG